MSKIGRPRGLIRYASLNGIERREPLRFTPRLGGYAVVLICLITLWFLLVFTRSDVEATLLRAQGALFQEMPNGHLSNLYTIKLLNKTRRPIPIQLKLESPAGEVQVMGNKIVVPPEQLSQTSVLIELDKKQMLPGKTPLAVGVFSGNRRIKTIKTTFIGPRNDTDN
jgi:hypothetical protein